MVIRRDKPAAAIADRIYNELRLYLNETDTNAHVLCTSKFDVCNWNKKNRLVLTRFSFLQLSTKNSEAVIGLGTHGSIVQYVTRVVGHFQLTHCHLPAPRWRRWDSTVYTPHTHTRRKNYMYIFKSIYLFIYLKHRESKSKKQQLVFTWAKSAKN